MKTPLLTLVILLAGAGIGSAQTKSAPLDLQYRERPPAVVTVPPRQLEADTTQAMSEIDRQRTEEMLRQAQPGPSARPDLDHDVTQGVQSRGLGGALRR